jgi:phosphatidylglycerol:prolipoprotein diacylglycerol transferase
MSFHGGFLGVLVAMGLWARKQRINWWDITDFIAPLVPLGLAAGRLGNFINGELWGRVTDASLPWAMVFPQSGDMLPRHPPSFITSVWKDSPFFNFVAFSGRPRPRRAVSGVFLIGYGCFRFITEFFREPDAGIFGQSYTISMGQWLSLPMVLGGVVLLVLAYRKKSL